MQCLRLFMAIVGILFCHLLAAQQKNSLQEAIQHFTQEKDPVKAVAMMHQLIKDYKLDSIKDAETFDMLHGVVAVVFVLNGNYAAFENHMKAIRNPFNQTSFLNNAAEQLLTEGIDTAGAVQLARRTIDTYNSFRDDPSARPAGFAEADWKRFMDFAQYPYYDTYAHALFATKQYKEAQAWQLKAFDGLPEEGMPSSVERYAQLLELNGEKQAAKDLLLTVASLGKLNKNMIAQLKAMYVTEKGSDAGFDDYLYAMQAEARAALVTSLKKKMLDEPAPGFTLKDLNGKVVKLSDFKGRTVIIDLWATWCRPCIASFPALQKMQRKHKDVAFLFIAVNEEGPDALSRVKQFIKKNGYDFTVLMDAPVAKGSEKFQVISAYQPKGIPAKYIIDKTGTLRFKSAGFDTDSQLINELEAMITVMNAL